MKLLFEALDSALVQGWRKWSPDAYGAEPERVVAEGAGNPCRHCLDFVPEGAGMLILAHRPFSAPQPYAETGPIFVCADDCARGGGGALPPILRTSPDYILRGYGADERIVYGTGRVVRREEVETYARDLLKRSTIAFVDVRSARNNCFQLRIRRV